MTTCIVLSETKKDRIHIMGAKTSLLHDFTPSRLLIIYQYWKRWYHLINIGILSIINEQEGGKGGHDMIPVFCQCLDQYLKYTLLPISMGSLCISCSGLGCGLRWRGHFLKTWPANPSRGQIKNEKGPYKICFLCEKTPKFMQQNGYHQRFFSDDVKWKPANFTWNPYSI